MDSHMQKNETTILLYHIQKKKNSKWIQELNVIPEAIELLEKIIGHMLFNTVLAIFFWICLLRQEQQ